MLENRKNRIYDVHSVTIKYQLVDIDRTVDSLMCISVTYLSGKIKRET